MGGGHFRIVGRVEPCYGVVEYVLTIRRRLDVVLDALQPEPDGIAAVVARTAAPAE